MCPDHLRQSQRGAGLPVALFIITVLSLLVLGMAQLQQSSGEAISLQIQSQRAFFAAESGAQVGVGEVLQSDDCSTVPGAIAFPAAALAGCSATLTCDDTNDVTIEGRDYLVVQVNSSGQCGGGGPDEANRTVEVMVRVR